MSLTHVDEHLNPLPRDTDPATEACGRAAQLRQTARGVVRVDVDITDVLHLVGGISKISAPEPGRTERILDVALDGLRRVRD